MCPEFRGRAKKNQCHGTVALAIWAPLYMMLNKQNQHLSWGNILKILQILTRLLEMVDLKDRNHTITS